MIILQYAILFVLFILSAIFVANAIPAFMRRTDKLGYFPDWLIFISGWGIVIMIIMFPLLFLSLKDAQEKIEEPVQYELVNEHLYRIKQ